MRPDQRHTLNRDGDTVVILDQTRLPHERVWRRLTTLAEVEQAINCMQVRGAPLIGVTAAYGVALGLAESADDDRLEYVLERLGATRPTAVNLAWALGLMAAALRPLPAQERSAAAWRNAEALADADAACNRAIGEHGLAALSAMARPGRPLRVMTHCNAGWLATLGWGTALAPVYAAHAAGLPVSVWVSETRPRNQGLLTAWELDQCGVPHTLIADNAAGHLMALGEVDVVIVGADRIAANGDTANKVGTYLKALAAQACGVPFWVAAPCSTIDANCADGKAVVIEARDGDELRHVSGRLEDGNTGRVAIVPSGTAIFNPAFDLTPADLIGAIICERGVLAPADLARIVTLQRGPGA